MINAHRFSESNRTIAFKSAVIINGVFLYKNIPIILLLPTNECYSRFIFSIRFMFIRVLVNKKWYKHRPASPMIYVELIFASFVHPISFYIYANI